MYKCDWCRDHGKISEERLEELFIDHGESFPKLKAMFASINGISECPKCNLDKRVSMWIGV